MDLRETFDRALLEDPMALLGDEFTALIDRHFPELARIRNFGGRASGHKALWPHTVQVVSQCPPNVLIRWAALYHDVGKPDCAFRVRNEWCFHGHELRGARLFHRAAIRLGIWTHWEAQYIEYLVSALGDFEEYDRSWNDSAVRRLAKKAGWAFHDLVDLARADISTVHVAKRTAIHAGLDDLRTRAAQIVTNDAIPAPLVTGLGTVLAAEFNVQGRQIGILMERAKKAVEDGLLPAQAPAAQVVQWLRQHNGEP